jgi:hypothetical protein
MPVQSRITKGSYFGSSSGNSTALAVVFADKTMFQPIHDHFEERLFGEFATIQQKKRKEEKNKDQQKAKVRKREKQRRIPRAKWEGQLLTSSSITDAQPILHQVCQGGQLISKTKKTT